MTKQPQRQPHWRKILAVGSLLLATAIFGSTACLPYPVMFQIEQLTPCSGSGSTTGISFGALDVSVRGTYILGFKLTNLLGQVSNTAAFRPETNFIQTKELKIWFEYPPNFSLTGSEYLYTQDKPYILKVTTRINPSVLPDFQGLSAGAVAQVSSQTETQLLVVYPETALVWAQAQELKDIRKGNIFIVYAHFVFTGETGTGSVVTTQDKSLPIVVCLGCLDEAVNPNCKGGSGGTTCVGQDGACRPKPTATP